LFRVHAELCKALANEHRLAIIYALSQGELCVGGIAEKLDIPLHKVSQHLRILKERMLVEPRKEAQTVYYSITNPGFIEGCTIIRRALVEQYQAQGGAMLAGDMLDAVLRQPGSRQAAPSDAA
jgi:ArsR family transcriptional regulator